MRQSFTIVDTMIGIHIDTDLEQLEHHWVALFGESDLVKQARRQGKYWQRKLQEYKDLIRKANDKASKLRVDQFENGELVDKINKAIDHLEICKSEAESRLQQYQEFFDNNNLNLFSARQIDEFSKNAILDLIQ